MISLPLFLLLSRTRLLARARSLSLLVQVLTVRFGADYLRDPKKFLNGVLVRAGIGVVLGVVWLGQAGTTQASIFPVQVIALPRVGVPWQATTYL